MKKNRKARECGMCEGKEKYIQGFGMEA